MAVQDWSLSQILSQYLTVPEQLEKWLITAFTPGPKESYVDPCGVYSRAIIVERIGAAYAAYPKDVVVNALNALAGQRILSVRGSGYLAWPPAAQAVRITPQAARFLPVVWPKLMEEYVRLDFEQLAAEAGWNAPKVRHALKDLCDAGVIEWKGKRHQEYRRGSRRAVACYPNYGYKGGRMVDLDNQEDLEKLRGNTALNPSPATFSLEEVEPAFSSEPGECQDPCGFYDLDRIVRRISDLRPGLSQEQIVQGLHRLVSNRQLEKRSVAGRDFLRCPGGDYAIRFGPKGAEAARVVIAQLRLRSTQPESALLNAVADAGLTKKNAAFVIGELVKAGGLEEVGSGLIALGKPVRLAVYPRLGYFGGREVNLWGEDVTGLRPQESAGVATTETLPPSAPTQVQIVPEESLRSLEAKLEEWRRLTAERQAITVPLQTLRQQLIAGGKSAAQVESAIAKLAAELELDAPSLPSDEELAALAAGLDLWRKYLLPAE